MKRHSILTLLLAALLLAFATGAPAQDDDDGPSTREVVDQQLADLKSDLNLNDYTWSQVEMILKSSIRQRVAIAHRYGLEDGPEAWAKLEGKQKRALKRELKNARKDTAKRMKRYLDKDQYKAFKAEQETLQEQFLERIGAD